MMESSSLQGQTVSHYRIIEILGSGGMGIVYRAHDEQLDRDVAVKVLPSGRITDDSARRRFRKEALALAKMNHPNIETVHEFASEKGVDYLVTEYIQGKTLGEHLKAGPLSERDVTSLGAQIAAALEEAQDRGIIHCDLKPGNIIVTPKRHAKVLDFGLARLLRPTGDMTTDTISQTTGLTGTLPYMAPEQLNAQAADARTDVHALGLVLYEMATGERAFREDSVPSLIESILHQMPTLPRERNASLSADLEHIILKALDKDPERRYQSAREMRVDLERLRTPTAPITALRSSDTLWKGIWKTLRTHPRRTALSMSMIAVALVAIFWFVGTRPVLSFSPRDWILLTDFDNQTGETVFDRSLLAALTVSLEQSAHANIFPRERLPDTLKRMNRPATEGINESVGREICLRENIRGLLNCGIARVGQEYVLSAQLIDPHSGNSVRSYLERAKGQDNVLNALDNIASRLRRDLGESLSSIQMADRPLPLVTTSSLQALKNYVDASDVWSRGKYQEAVPLYKNAVQLDPDFAMAHAALGGAYYSFIFNDPVDGKTEYEKALQLSTRTTERERLSIQLGYAANLNHVGEADNLYHLYLDKYPDDWRMRSNFAGMLRENGQYQEAIEQYLEVIRIAPKDGSAYINVATSYSGLGQTADALRYYGQAFELEPTWKSAGNLNHEYGFALVRNGDETAARTVFELALEKPDMKGLAQRSLGWLALYHGQYRAARASFEAALLYYAAIKAPLSEARQDFLLSIVADGQSDRVRTLHQLDEAAKFLPELGPKVWMGSLTGCAYARAGVPKKAEKILQSTKPAVDFNNAEQSSQYHRLEGEIALAQGRKARALESFKLAQNEKSGAQTMEALARAYVAAGDLNQAIAWYEKLIESPSPPLGWEPQQDWLAAHYHLAKAYLTRGDKAKAAPVLKELLTLWKDADPDIPILIAAKSEYAKLK
jgi:serine/threonine protein kinase/tetratricopeptide (TPR) repeat protein